MEYPADLELDAPLEVARWRPLVHWLLGIPHLMIAGVLGNVAGVISLVSWFVIVFTGRLPEGLANFQCMVMRYSARTYSYVLWLREPYPVFDFTMTPEDPGGDPVVVVIRPQLENRNRLTVGLRFLWIIPIALFTALVGLAAFFVAIAAFFAVLFTGRWPEGMRRFIVNTGRLGTRLSAYSYLLVDDYPPFALT
ncbi:MAG TPA: DUF4389 domain-containing protein [Acidimicrobiales bacterium]